MHLQLDNGRQGVQAGLTVIVLSEFGTSPLWDAYQRVKRAALATEGTAACNIKCQGGAYYCAARQAGKRLCCSHCYNSCGYLRGIMVVTHQDLQVLNGAWRTDKGEGYWSDTGCRLPRWLRSMTCVSYVCRFAETPKAIAAISEYSRAVIALHELVCGVPILEVGVTRHLINIRKHRLDRTPGEYARRNGHYVAHAGFLERVDFGDGWFSFERHNQAAEEWRSDNEKRR